jgi:hypothetical protein
MLAMRIAIAILLISLSSPLFASKEGMLALATLQLESDGVGESGPVKITGSQTPAGVTSLRVDAFDKTFELSPSQLKTLDGGLYNFIQLSYERGYKELGGRTIYIKLGIALTSGEDTAIFIAIHEDGQVKITRHL